MDPNQAEHTWKNSSDEVYRAFGKSLSKVVAKNLAVAQKRNNPNRGTKIEEKPKPSGSAVKNRINSPWDVLDALIREARDRKVAQDESKRIREHERVHRITPGMFDALIREARARMVAQERQAHVLDSVPTYNIYPMCPAAKEAHRKYISTSEQQSKMWVNRRVARFENFLSRDQQKRIKAMKEKVAVAVLEWKMGQVVLDENKDGQGSAME